ncbi:hypothetical protein IscW_ISCW007790 [Ixodes scapularis]|uniref:Uncharacterized protein n=1 Tax=Ixodes scapularis TaxID=6945 RepID=B7PWF3_IXOSC|nr:hypothetical protein IscW_ISCW007790 [Ixodes scapularis]|eukprot:XP_002409746.1 hypothetical protein IscW_ISCW007790 [Ixodes scapularis]
MNAVASSVAAGVTPLISLADVSHDDDFVSGPLALLFPSIEERVISFSSKYCSNLPRNHTFSMYDEKLIR